MTGRVLYEITADESIPGLKGVLFTLVFAAFAAMVFLMIRHRRSGMVQMSVGGSAQGLLRPVCFIAALFVLLAFLAGLGQIHAGQTLMARYRNGEYQVVEGVVEHFDPMPAEGHKHESFDIDGVRFEYSDYREQPGYHQARSHHGVITGDGQHLRIRYIWYDDSIGNIILYIEENPSQVIAHFMTITRYLSHRPGAGDEGIAPTPLCGYVMSHE